MAKSGNSSGDQVLQEHLFKQNELMESMDRLVTR